MSSPVHNTARIEWTGATEHDAGSLANGPASPAEKSKLDEAKEFLRDELASGPMWAKIILRDARDAGVASATLYSAKSALRIRSEKIGVEGWQWSLPPKKILIPPRGTRFRIFATFATGGEEDLHNFLIYPKVMEILKAMKVGEGKLMTIILPRTPVGVRGAPRRVAGAA